jgi:hypothetical protein
MAYSSETTCIKIFPCNNILIDFGSLNAEKMYNLISILIMIYKVAFSPVFESPVIINE